MSQIKINRANKLAPHLPTADAEIWESIPQSLIDSLTGKQLAEIKKALNHHWHKAVAFATKGGQVIDDCLWTGERLIPMAAIKAISIDELPPMQLSPGNPNSHNPLHRQPLVIKKTNYKLDFVESH